jgi:hypothetical protein
VDKTARLGYLPKYMTKSTGFIATGLLATALLGGGCSNSEQDCLIKGNINEKHQKIYHMPGDMFYEKTEIDESKGEQWFCTPEEAKNAGWRASKV